MPGYHTKACCADLGLGGRFRMPGPVLVPEHAGADASAPLPDNDPIERDLGTAWQEAGHAVAFTMLGIAVADVEIDPLQLCRLSQTEDPNADFWRANAIGTLAGPIGEAWLAKWRSMPSAEDLQPFVEAARRPREGSCDRCRAARCARRWLGGEPSAEEITATLQRLHCEATALVTSRLGTLAIKDIADGLMRDGWIAGDDVRCILDHRKSQLGEET